MNLIFLLLLILVLLGVPATGWHSYGWYPSGALGTVLIVLLILAFLGRL